MVSKSSLQTSDTLMQDFVQLATPVLSKGHTQEMAHYIQHGDTSTLLHVTAVAYYSLKLSRKLKLNCDEHALVTGALLHDYYLYDWHIDDGTHGRWHGFTHPGCALRNANRDFDLPSRSQDLIARHMFPLTPVPPHHREGIVVCLVDKVCSTWETLGKNRYGQLRELLDVELNSR